MGILMKGTGVIFTPRSRIEMVSLGFPTQGWHLYTVVDISRVLDNVACERQVVLPALFVFLLLAEGI